ncbi:MAG: hypothetical protein ACI3U1_06200, partial [Peptococcaceae bacterium]
MTEMQSRAGRFLQQLPVPVCGLTLGLAALGNMLAVYASTVQWFYIGFAAVLWLLLLFKIMLYWPQTRCELQNPLTCSVFEAFFMTLLQFSAVLAV